VVENGGMCTDEEVGQHPAALSASASVACECLRCEEKRSPWNGDVTEPCGGDEGVDIFDPALPGRNLGIDDVVDDQVASQRRVLKRGE
jgi:hypothetical protein